MELFLLGAIVGIWAFILVLSLCQLENTKIYTQEEYDAALNNGEKK